jgi:hypothetical protein
MSSSGNKKTLGERMRIVGLEHSSSRALLFDAVKQVPGRGGVRLVTFIGSIPAVREAFSANVTDLEPFQLSEYLGS